VKVAVLSAAYWLVCWLGSRLGVVGWLGVPFLLWGAFRLGPAATGAAIAGIATAAIGGALRHHGSFAGESLGDGSLWLQLAVALLAAAALLLGAAASKRRETETVLRQSEQKYREIFDNVSDSLWVLDVVSPARFRFAGVNAAAEKLTGLTDVSARGKFIEEVLRPQQVAHARNHFQRCLQQGQPLQYEETGYGPSGHLSYLRTTLLPVRDRAGQITRLIVVNRDITERKQAEDALRVSQAELTAIYEHAPALMSLLDEDLNLVRINHAGSRTAGRAGESWGDSLALEVLTCASPAGESSLPCGACGRCRLRQMLRDTLASGQQYCGVEVPINLQPSRPAAETWALIDTARIVVESKPRVLLCAQDITARKAAEAALRQSEKLYRLLAENVSDVIWVMDLKTTRLRYISPSVERLRGVTVEEAMAQGMEGSVASESLDFVRRAIPERVARLSRQQGGIYTDEVALRHKNGDLVWAELVTHFHTNEEDGSVEIYGVTRDITERKRLQDELRQAQKMEAIGQLAGGVAHDFNNILAAIMMNLDLMRLNPRTPPELLASIDELETSAKRAASLTRQLLVFGRRSLVQLRPLELNEVVENLLKMLRRILGEHIELHFRPSPLELKVQADSGMLDQVVLNLAVNARDAMPAGGRLEILTESVGFDEEQVKLTPLRRVGTFACLSVTDTGCGMSEGTLKHIFEPFFTTKELGKGTGLGLATVFGIMKQHQGWVEVESAIGRGSRFRVFLPTIVVGPPLPAPAVRPAEPLTMGSETILLVEDDACVRRMLAACLRELGYRTLEAASGPEALAQWRDRGSQVDLLLTDLMLPEGMSGLELARCLRGERPDLPVLLSTGYSAEVTGVGGSAAEGFPCLPKPYEAGRLSAALRACLDGTPPAAV